eukprot:TRINITY_DN4013_c0_g4_i1.p1 TRINITY_DN4013_c0_g4~~TRINITY_DN4013_c0_g4_i1.p1  ORF type:complete len:299 (-),score=68.43 TRINITY_DN4013_c0_g4_i1:139-1035(-)
MSITEIEFKKDRVLVIERTPYKEDYDTNDFNTNNHSKDESDIEAKDLDYKVEIARTNLEKWSDVINYPIAFQHKFLPGEVKYLLEASHIGRISQRVSSLHTEELEQITERLELEMKNNNIVSLAGWFFRFSSCSPKDGCRNFPMLSAKEIVDQIASSERAFKALTDGNTTIYLCKFDPQWVTERELRVFISKGKITAISQYNAFSRGLLSNFTQAENATIVRNIVELIEEKLFPTLLEQFGTPSFVADIYVEESLDVRVIEFNSFGYWLAAGSALFHWLKDKGKMYNTEGKIYYRLYD